MNKLQAEIDQAVKEFKETKKEYSKLAIKIDRSFNSLNKKHSLQLCYWDIIKTYTENNKYFLVHNTKNDILQINKPFFENLGKLGLITLALQSQQKRIEKLKDEYKKLALDVLNKPEKTITLNVEKKKLNIIDLVNDNTVFEFTIMNSSNSLPSFMPIFQNDELNYTNENVVELKNNVVRIGNYMLDLCCYNLFTDKEKTQDDFMSEYWQALNTENNFFNRYRKEFCRLSLVFADKPIYWYLGDDEKKAELELQALEEKTTLIDLNNKVEVLTHAKNYVNSKFTPFVKKTWLAVNDIALKRYRTIQKDENKKGEFLTDCIVTTSIDEILNAMGIVKTRDNDTVYKKEIEKSLNVLEFCKLQATKWVEGVGEKERAKLIRQKESGLAIDVGSSTKPIFDVLKNFNPRYDDTITKPDIFAQGRVHKRGFVNIITKGIIDNQGNVTLYFSNSYLNYIVKQNNFSITSSLLSIDSRNPNAWSLGIRLAQLLCIQTNSVTAKEKIEKRKQSKIIKKNTKLENRTETRTVVIEKLLPYTTIPNKEQVKLYNNREYKRYIIKPFLLALEVLKQWHDLNYDLINSTTKEKISIDVAEHIKIDEFLKLQVQYNFCTIDKKNDKK